jgi:hypothetical protein
MEAAMEREMELEPATTKVHHSNIGIKYSATHAKPLATALTTTYAELQHKYIMSNTCHQEKSPRRRTLLHLPWQK